MDRQGRRAPQAENPAARMLDLCRETLQRCLAGRVELQDRPREANDEIDRLRLMLDRERRIRDPDGRDPAA